MNKQSKIKMMLLLLAFTATAAAQNTFFPTKEGTVMVTAHKNAKGNAESYSKLTIGKVEGSGANMTVPYVVESLDKNRKPANPPTAVPLKMVIRDGVMIIDMKSMFAEQAGDPEATMEITGVPMELPADMKPGQALKDAEMTMTMDMVIMKMTTTITMTGGKCLAIEEVTVSAGTFTCYKITQTLTTTVMKRNMLGRYVSWYAPGIGAVKTETYDEKDRLQGTTELVELN
ncbi:MAG: hypothetical protein LBE56_01010 [Tannerella sp.]|jgi:hypothetical protein|nr:hypothetical protein [Tannerella sp.]